MLAALEIARFSAPLLAACLSGLLVNGIAPPNLLLQHLPAWAITAQPQAADAHSHPPPPSHTEAPPPTSDAARRTGKSYTITLISIQKG